MIKCRNCGADLKGTEKFCGECGTVLSAPEAVKTPEVPELTLDTPASLLADMPEAEKAAENVPSAAVSVMNAEPPKAPGAAQMPKAPAQENTYTRPEVNTPVVAVPPVNNGAQGSYTGNPYVQSQRDYVQPAKSDAPDRVLSTGGFLLSLFLMSLPLVGLILQIVWSCNDTTTSLNRRNLARAYLILTCIGVVISLILVFTVGILAAIGAALY